MFRDLSSADRRMDSGYVVMVRCGNPETNAGIVSGFPGRVGELVSQHIPQLSDIQIPIHQKD